MDDCAQVENKPNSTENDTLVTSKKPRKLTLKQKGFAKAYTDIENPVTFSNATQSVKLAYNIDNNKTASVIGTENLGKLSIQNEIQEIMERQGIGIEQRSSKLAQYITHADPSLPQVTRTYKDGDTTVQETTKPISAAGLAKLFDLANKTEGLYNKARVAESLAKREYAKLADSLLSKLRARAGEGGKEARGS